MSNAKIIMEYHPVLEEVKFQRWENGSWAAVGENSALNGCFWNKSVFLQNLGNELFESILKATDEATHIEIQFVGTKGDFDDLKTMVDYYNENKQCGNKRFSIDFLVELPDMTVIYEDIKNYGEDVVETFEKYSSKFEEIGKLPMGTAEKIRVQIDMLEENDVNLCFVGGFSSGKSTLINAMLGYGILPVSIESKTAKMFKIINCDRPAIHVNVFDSKTKTIHKTIIEWDLSQLCFIITSGPNENLVKKDIQKKLNEITLESMELHEQMGAVLELINSLPNELSVQKKEDRDYIDGIVEVYFEIPLSGKMNFTIYDTPGTDSNQENHLQILKEALKVQTNSILIYVNWPNNVEGSSNRILNELIKDIKQDNELDYSSINLNRSLFVMNGSDTLNGHKDFEKLKEIQLPLLGKNNEIDDNKTTGDDRAENVGVSMADKRLFFTSAYVAYAARAKKNGVALYDEEEELKRKRYDLLESKARGYFKYNQLSKADHETKEMLDSCAEEANRAEENNDEIQQYIVNAGLYALEREIIKYSEKYALAVKTKSLYELIEKPLEHLNRECRILEQNKHADLSEIRNLVDLNMKTMKESINRCKLDFIEKNTIIQKPNGRDLVNITKKFGLGEDYFNNILERVKDIGDKEIDKGNLWEIREQGLIEKEISDFEEKINKIIGRQLFDEIYKRIDDKLKGNSKDIEEQINQIVERDSEITPELASYIKEIEYTLTRNTEKMNLRIPIEKKRIIISYRKSKMNKKAIIEEARIEIQKIMGDIMIRYFKLYNEKLEEICYKVAKAYTDNIDLISVKLLQLKENHVSAEKELTVVSNLVSEISHQRVELKNKMRR